MRIAVSNLSFMGFNCVELKKLQPQAGIEIFYEFGNTYYWETVLDTVRGQAQMRPLSLHGPCHGINLANPSHTHYRSFYEQMISDAAKWNADFVVAHTNEEYEGNAEELKKLVYNRLAVIAQIAKKYQVQLVLENVGLNPKGNLLFDWDAYQKLLGDFPQAGALIDVGHAFINEWPLPEIIQTLGHRITAYHLHDNDGQNDLHLPIHAGKIAWDDFFKAANQYTPDALLILEYANVSFDAVDTSIKQVEARYFHSR